MVLSQLNIDRHRSHAGSVFIPRGNGRLGRGTELVRFVKRRIGAPLGGVRFVKNAISRLSAEFVL
jgi:hypothetical protein